MMPLPAMVVRIAAPMRSARARAAAPAIDRTAAQDQDGLFGLAEQHRGGLRQRTANAFRLVGGASEGAGSFCQGASTAP